jgi:hypothetical protein
MVRLKSSFDKSWGDVNEIRNDGNEWNSLGKTGSEKGELLSQRHQIATTDDDRKIYSFLACVNMTLMTACSACSATSVGDLF